MVSNSRLQFEESLKVQVLDMGYEMIEYDMCATILPMQCRV